MSNANSLYKKDEEIIINSKIENIAIETPIVVNPSQNNNELYDNIKKIFSEGEKVKKDNIYFTISKGMVDFKIDGTIFSPSKLSLLQPKKFEEIFIKQLESFIYNSKEEIDTSKLFPIIYLFSHINKNNYPIKIVTSGYNKLTPKICNVLNTFFNKNYSVIYSIYTMMNSIKDTEEEGGINHNTEIKPEEELPEIVNLI